MKYQLLLTRLAEAEEKMRTATSLFAAASRDLHLYCGEVERHSQRIADENGNLCDRIWQLEHPEGKT